MAYVDDLLNLQPSVIDRSLSGKTVLLAGIPKIGKSEFCSQSPKTLILDTQNGYNAHPGVTKIPFTNWSDLKKLLKALEDPRMHEKYSNIAIDVINDAWELCTKHICQQEGVQKIKEIRYGQGYQDRDTEFASALRKIINMNYGLILTSHIKETTIEVSEGVTKTLYAPDLDKRCLPIINGLNIMGHLLSNKYLN